MLTPDGYDKPVYCTVFLDEAFSNTAEVLAEECFVSSELHIHVNLITPIKSEFSTRVSEIIAHAERDPELHESHLCEVTWRN